LAHCFRYEEARAGPLCPGSSDVHLLGDSECVIDLDPEIADRALDLPVAQQELHRPEIAGSPVDEGGLGRLSEWVP
jgi:hypothetical protein